ncbi:HAD family hydrolase [Candidatus Woesearchaeota archaeon]|nr:HAD family hydrolase [Candidatus Woesearchaeota archaeon]
MEYKAILFDLDGTLVHTAPEYRYNLVRLALNEFEKRAENNVIDRFWFEARRNDIIIQEFGLNPEVFWQTYKKHETANFDLRKKLTKPYEDTLFLNHLQTIGYKLGIVTGAPIYIADLEIAMLDANRFGHIVIAQPLNGVRPKPDPHGLNICMEKLGVKADETIYVGNSDEDIIAAKSAKIFDVLIDRKEHLFNGLRPSLTIESLYELKRLV